MMATSSIRHPPRYDPRASGIVCPASFPESFKDFFTTLDEDEDGTDLLATMLEDKLIPRCSDTSSESGQSRDYEASRKTPCRRVMSARTFQRRASEVHCRIYNGREMDYSTDWNVDAYRTDEESDEHWELRRQFMVRWRGEFSEDRLVCLSRVFTNIEFLGCRYPLEVMKLVANLSREVAADHREKKKKKLQRTFVSASSAAEDRAKGVKRPANDQNAISSRPNAPKVFVAAQSGDRETFVRTPQVDNQTEVRSSRTPSGYQSQTRMTNERPSFHQEANSRIHGRNNPSQMRNNNNMRDRNPRNNARMMESGADDSIVTSMYGRLVLHDRPGTYASKLYGSCQSCKVPIMMECEPTDSAWTCRVVVNDRFVASALGPSQKEAKEAAAQVAWGTLQGHCYTLLVRQAHASQDDRRISAQDVEEDHGQARLVDGLDTRVDSAVATRIMKMMGWSGGALGSASDGISEPIAPHLKQIRRAGLGSAAGSGARALSDALRRSISEFSREGSSDYDLVFASDFSKEERADMHKIALRCGLKSKSYGKDDDRYLVISKHVTVSNIVRSLLSSGGSNDKYTLIPPSSTGM